MVNHDGHSQRSATRTVWAFFQVVGHVFAPWRRGWRLRWGARAGDPDPTLPGEDMISDANWEFTHAISIAAPADAVWPWIAQIGQGRGGFYSFERLENALGCRIVNADTILPEHQSINIDDEIRLHPSSPPLHVAVVEPGRSLVLRGLPADTTSDDTESLWAFHLVEGEQDGTCRLIERGKTKHGTSLTDRLFFSPLLVEPIGFVMSREMLLGTKERSEASR